MVVERPTNALIPHHCDTVIASQCVRNRSGANDTHSVIPANKPFPISTPTKYQRSSLVKQLVNHHQWLFYVTNIRVSYFPIILMEKTGSTQS